MSQRKKGIKGRKSNTRVGAHACMGTHTNTHTQTHIHTQFGQAMYIYIHICPLLVDETGPKSHSLSLYFFSLVINIIFAVVIVIIIVIQKFFT